MRTEDGAISRGVWAPPEAGKGREHVLPWSLRRNRPCRRLASGRRDPFRSPEERCGSSRCLQTPPSPGSLVAAQRARAPPALAGLRGAGGRDALRSVAPRGVDSWLLLPTMERGSQRLHGCQFSPSSRTCSVTDGALDPGVSRRASGAPPGQMGVYPTGRRPLDWGHDAGPLGIAPSLCGNGRGLLDAGAQVLCPV